MKWLLNIFILALASGVAWFFFGKRDEEAVSAEGVIDITVKGGYHPAAIRIKRGRTTTLRFTRQDPSSCVEEVVIPEFSIRQFLPMDTPTEIKITPKKTGTIPFQCGMGMIHGKIEVVA